MKTPIIVDYPAVRTMATELSRMSGKDYRDILRSEGASIIKISALGSPIASLAQIKQQVTDRSGSRFTGQGGEITVNVNTNKGRVWFTQDNARAARVTGPLQPDRERHVVKSGGFYMLFDAGPSRGHHVPDALWAEYLLTAGERAQYISARVKEIAGRRGIERQSWLQTGDAMGVSLSTVAPQGNLREDIARAASVHGVQYSNGFAREAQEGTNFVIHITNTSPVAAKRRGQSRLDAAINQRTRGFTIAMEKGVLLDLTRRAQRWPGIFVKPV